MLNTTTELEAVNIILSTIGESPIDTLEDNDNADVDNILRLIQTNSRILQGQGWDFNTINEFVLKPDKNSKTIRFDTRIITYKAADGGRYAKRGAYLYDMENNTDKFEKDVTLKVIYAVDFTDLPEEFKDYIIAHSAVQFQQRYLGDDNVSQELQRMQQEAYQRLVEYDIQTADCNMLNLPDVASILTRT